LFFLAECLFENFDSIAYILSLLWIINLKHEKEVIDFELQPTIYL